MEGGRGCTLWERGVKGLDGGLRGGGGVGGGVGGLRRG